jgi:ankyrin repeat protein
MQQVFNSEAGQLGAVISREAARVGAEPDMALVKRCITAGADVNRRGPMMATALMYAAFNGHAALVTLLLGAGADPTLRDTVGTTARAFAERRGHKDIAEQLGAAEKSFGAAAPPSGDPLPVIADVRDLNLALGQECWRLGNAGAAKIAQLIAAGAEVNRPDIFGTPPLITATKRGNNQVMQLLLDAGANPFALDKTARTARGWANELAGGDGLAEMLAGAEREYKQKLLLSTPEAPRGIVKRRAP